MSQKTKTELEILFTAYDSDKRAETAHKLVEILRKEIDGAKKENAILEADIRKLELFLADKG